jgi:hypothetical protein
VESRLGTQQDGATLSLPSAVACPEAGHAIPAMYPFTKLSWNGRRRGGSM